ncbi:MAG: hypothetical protein ACXWVI_02475 [Methyloceanibacter sp.]
MFARWLSKAGAELLADADLIVPVPLYQRGSGGGGSTSRRMLARALGRLASRSIASC